MSNKQNDIWNEQLEELEMEVNDCSRALKQAKSDLLDADIWLKVREVRLEKAKEELEKFKNKEL